MSNSTVILCADDDPAALKVRALVLSGAGYRILTAANGEAALRLFRVKPVDLVIISPSLSEITLTGVVGQMKQIHPKVPIILLSALMDPLTGFEQADLFLTKGITPPEFLAAVDAAVAKCRRGAESERR